MKEFLIIAGVFFNSWTQFKKKYQLCLTKWELETGHYLWGGGSRSGAGGGENGEPSISF